MTILEIPGNYRCSALCWSVCRSEQCCSINIAELLLLCCIAEKLKHSSNLFAVKYVIMLKYRQYPIDDKVLINAEVRL